MAFRSRNIRVGWQGFGFKERSVAGLPRRSTLASVGAMCASPQPGPHCRHRRAVAVLGESTAAVFPSSPRKGRRIPSLAHLSSSSMNGPVSALLTAVARPMSQHPRVTSRQVVRWASSSRRFRSDSLLWASPDDHFYPAETSRVQRAEGQPECADLVDACPCPITPAAQLCSRPRSPQR